MPDYFSVCSVCNNEKPRTTSARCRSCANEALRKYPNTKARRQAWVDRNPGYFTTPARQDVGRASSYRRNYGMTIEQYDVMFEFQGGVCALCKKPPKTRRLNVDHDHKTGRVRGLLCTMCNKGLHERVTVEWLTAAAAYLTVHPSEMALGSSPQGKVGRVSRRRRKKRG